MAVAKRWMTAALCAISLSGCGFIYDANSFTKSVTPWQDDKSSENAMLAFDKGDLIRAEALGNQAVRRNPKDPYALLVLAMVYQNTARPDLARQYYEALVSMHPQVMAMTGTGPNMQRRSIEDIARANLAAMGAPLANDMPMMTQISGGGGLASAPVVVADGDQGYAEDGALITRFRTLKRLLDEGLITREEYDQRRAANLGALLPYTAPRPAAAGLGRPAPAPEQIISRLKALAGNFEEKSISAVEQSTERSIILDALLPVKSDRRADRPPPANDQMKYAALSGRLQRLLEANVITSAEAARERKAMEGQVAAAAAQADASALMRSGVPVVMSPSGPGLALGQYGSQMKAEIAWEELQRRFPEELGSLQSSVKKVTSRRYGSGYRLTAGPVVDKKTALGVCRILKRQGAPCASTVMK